MRTGDRVDAVLECVTEEKDGRVLARVFVRLVDAPPSEGGARPPAPLPGAQRNIVQRWLGVPDEQTGFAAFAIDCGPAGPPATGQSVAAALEDFRRLRHGPVGAGWQPAIDAAAWNLAVAMDKSTPADPSNEKGTEAR